MNKTILAYSGLAVGAGLVYGSFFMKKSLGGTVKELPDSLKPLLDFASEDTLLMINTDHLWMELCDRAADFALLGKEEFSEFLSAVANVIAFQKELLLGNKKITIGTPRLFASKLHMVIEAVRQLRASVEERAPYALDDFDEVAIDIQKRHDDEASNMILQSMSN